MITGRRRCYAAAVVAILRCAAAVVAMALMLARSPSVASSAEPLPVRVGVMQSGTVQWEMDVIARHGLDRREGVAVAAKALVGKDASAVAFQAGAVDVILTDFLWVSRARREGGDATFVPHSTATGAVMVRPDAGITTPAGLLGQRIGVGGNAADKSWLIFRAYGKRVLGADPARAMHPVFGAPPLLNELARRGEFPATLNFWNYAAQLKADGYPELLTVGQMMQALGLSPKAPLLGWVFSQHWAAAHPDAAAGFVRASLAASALMLRDDAEWDALRPLMGTSDRTTQDALRAAWRAGQVQHVTAADVAAAADLFHLLAEIGGPDVVGPDVVGPDAVGPDATGPGVTLAPGTFWDGLHF